MREITEQNQKILRLVRRYSKGEIEITVEKNQPTYIKIYGGEPIKNIFGGEVTEAEAVFIYRLSLVDNGKVFYHIKDGQPIEQDMENSYEGFQLT